jgi:hypothetical protein
MTLDLFWDELPDFAETDESPLSILKTWRATPVSIRPDLDMLDLGEAAMTKEEATEATHMLWAQTAAEIRKEREAELKAGTISQGKHVLRFNEKVFGKQPAEGYSLWISMHGGGGAPAYVNDQQWQNQTNLYTLDEGIYVAPRAPTDTWNLWHQGHIDNLFQRLIENYVACRGVNPNRIYILGYSAGGDGVFQLAPRMADFLAGAAMMAGHPNETQPTGLRNIGFALFMGGDDRAYDRNLIASKWKESLASLHKADPEGYKHWVQIYPQTGHWMNRRDAEALPWLANFTRQPWPQRVEWLQDDVTHNRFYWLSVEDENQIAGQRVTAWVEGQTIRIQADGLESIGLRLSDRLLNLDESLRVIWNKQLVFKGSVRRSAAVIYQSLNERADSELVATAYLEVNQAGD